MARFRRYNRQAKRTGEDCPPAGRTIVDGARGNWIYAHRSLRLNPPPAEDLEGVIGMMGAIHGGDVEQALWQVFGGADLSLRRLRAEARQKENH